MLQLDLFHAVFLGASQGGEVLIPEVVSVTMLAAFTDFWFVVP